ncbi:MAG: superinfection immunity protein [Chthoniobacteraceae bacterium]
MKKMMKWVVAAVLMATASTLYAATITDTDGNIYREAKVTQVEPDGLRITYAQGVAKIPFEKMPRALREQYHIDIGKAYVYRDALAHPQKQATTASNGLTIQPATPATAGQTPPPVEPQATPETKASNPLPVFAGVPPLQSLPPPPHDKSIFRLVILIVTGLIGFILYFLPSFLGLKKKDCLPIFLVNFFLAWTVIGWIATLLWAILGRSEEAPKSATPVKLVLSILLVLNLCGSVANYLWADQFYQMLKTIQEKQAAAMQAGHK